MGTFLYARVSTAEQNISHQQTQAEEVGFVFDDVIIDDGVSGISVRMKERPGGRRLFDILRAGDILVVRWIDRLGRDYLDVCDTIRTFMRKGVIIRTVISNMIFDGTTRDPMLQAVRDALIGFMAATAQAQVEASKEAQKAGIANARGKGLYRGRKPTFDGAAIAQVIRMQREGASVSLIARELGLSRQTVYRILANPTSANMIVNSWQPS